MKGFIPALAESLYERYGDEVSSLNILFPSRRARLFFSAALAEVAKRPVWQPRFVSLDAMMQDIAGIGQGDHVKLVTELYKVCSKYHAETFDKFYLWGEMLLADFDSIDKYMIDADMLFANIGDLRELESDLSYLTPEQLKIIRQFWINFGLDSHYSEEKEHFITIWRSLPVVYREFRESITGQGLAYTGMVHRLAAEKIRHDVSGVSIAGDEKYIVAGFNALSECEKTLFGWLKNGGQTEFYWDYDNYYVGNEGHEAGYFLRENILRFPTPPLYDTGHDNFIKPKEIVSVDAPSDSLQCKYVHTFLKELVDRGETPGKETAVVLTDESLLEPVLYSIPEEIRSVNVTMGYPLRQTTAYSFVERLIELRSRSRMKNGTPVFYHSDVEGILTHPYVLALNTAAADDIVGHVKKLSQVYVRSDMLNVGGVIGNIFRPAGDWQDTARYLKEILAETGRGGEGEDAVRRREFFSIIIENIIKLENSLKDCGVAVTTHTFTSLLRKVLQGIRIPYEGEPLDGVQIMGILETRNLDFKNVLVLSVNDDTFLGNRAAGSSFIPYNLRAGYGLPTPREHESVYGYYFYRLLQRAGTIHLAYCSASDDRRTGEPSRYIYQLRYESVHKMEHVSIPLNVSQSHAEPITVEKNGEVAGKLSGFLAGGGRELSPTSFYNYIECPLKFYFRSIANIRPEDEMGEDIDLPMFGTILHKAMEILYSPLKGVRDPRPGIKALIGSPAVPEAVGHAIDREYLHDESASEEDYGGSVLLVRDVVTRYIDTCILPFDAAQRDGFTIEELEKRVNVEFGGVAFGGLADRIDRLDSGQLRVVDYKTGSEHLAFRDLDALFSDYLSDRNPAVLQILLYSMMLHEAEKRDVQPALYYVRRMNVSGFSPLPVEGKTAVQSFLPYYGRLKEKLKEKLSQLFDMQNPFTQCEDKRVCEYCDYREICRR